MKCRKGCQQKYERRNVRRRCETPDLIANGTSAGPSEHVARRDEAVLSGKHIAALRQKHCRCHLMTRRLTGAPAFQRAGSRLAVMHARFQCSGLVSYSPRPFEHRGPARRFPLGHHSRAMTRSSSGDVKRVESGFPYKGREWFPRLAAALQLPHGGHELGGVRRCDGAAPLQDRGQLPVWDVSHMQLRGIEKCAGTSAISSKNAAAAWVHKKRHHALLYSIVADAAHSHLRRV